MPDTIALAILGKLMSKDDMLEEVKNRTEYGEYIVKIQAEYRKYLLKG